MKRFSMVLMLLVSSFSANAITAKEACEELKPVVKDMQSQTPMDIDYMTTLTGAQAIYAASACLLNYNYVIKSDVLLKEMMDTNDLSIEENLDFLMTEEGKETLQSIFDNIASNAAQTAFQPFAEIKGMKITYFYAFDDQKIPSVMATVMENGF